MAITTMLAATAIGSLLLAAPANAILDGTPDGSGHPYVGESYNGTWYCSGSLISSRVYVTAAHCFSDSVSSFGIDPATGASIVAVTFAPQGIDGGGTRYYGDYYFDPQFNVAPGKGLTHFDSHDVAVVVFNQPVPVATYAALPAIGQVSTLASNTPLTIVGYGIQDFTRGHGKPQPVITDIRTIAGSSFVQDNGALSSTFLKMAPQTAHGGGAVCSGDSGGPDLLAGSNVMLAENSFVNGGECSSVSYAYRLDTADAQNFIYSTAAQHGASLH